MTLLMIASADADRAAQWRDALSQAGHWTVAPPVASLFELRQALVRQSPALLLADLALHDGPLAGLLRVLRTGGRHQALPVLAVSPTEQNPALLDALQAGADSFLVNRGLTAPALAAAVADTLAGGADIGPWVAQQLLAHFGPDVPGHAAARVEELVNPLALTAPEQQLLRHLVGGLRLNDVAAVEGVPARALTARVRGIYRKMQWALRAGDLTLA
jgi:DNA-binding NarL/FixJ family response regulator